MEISVGKSAFHLDGNPTRSQFTRENHSKKVSGLPIIDQNCTYHLYTKHNRDARNSPDQVKVCDTYRTGTNFANPPAVSLKELHPPF